MSTRLAARLVAAVLVTAATGLLPSGPAQAAGCSTASGVSVVVDFHELGGGVQQACDAGGAGRTAATQFGDAGYRLTRVQKQPGFVCRVNGAPSSDPCVDTPPADAYWGLWWSDGTSGRWTYSSQGVDSLKVPSGGSVALSWNGSSGQHPPGVAPAKHATSSPSPTPTQQPSQQPTHSSAPPAPQPTHQPSPTSGGTTTTAGASSGAASGSTTDPTGTPSATRSGGGTKAASRQAGHRKHGHGSSAGPSTSPAPSVSGGPSGSDAPTPAAGVPTADAPNSDGGLPTWVAPAVVALLFAAAGGTAVVRRRRGVTHP